VDNGTDDVVVSYDMFYSLLNGGNWRVNNSRDSNKNFVPYTVLTVLT